MTLPSSAVLYKMSITSTVWRRWLSLLHFSDNLGGILVTITTKLMQDVLNIGEDGGITVNVNVEDMDGLAEKLCIKLHRNYREMRIFRLCWWGCLIKMKVVLNDLYHYLVFRFKKKRRLTIFFCESLKNR